MYACSLLGTPLLTKIFADGLNALQHISKKNVGPVLETLNSSHLSPIPPPFVDDGNMTTPILDGAAYSRAKYDVVYPRGLGV